MRSRRWLAAIPLLFLMGGHTISMRAGDPDPHAGKDLFQRRCSGCHSPDIDKVGPRLRGVLNRKAGTVAGFPYSEALRNSHISWDEKQLNLWLENPDSVVKNSDMEFRVANAEERASIIAYLKSLSE